MALKCHLCCFAAAPKVSQSQVHTGIAVSKPFPVVGGHPAPESGQTRLNGSVACASPAELRPFDTYVASSGRRHPPSGSGHHHHRSAADDDRLSSQTRPTQAQESPPTHNRGVRLSYQRHVSVAKAQSEEIGMRELDTRLCCFCFFNLFFGQSLHFPSCLIFLTCPPLRMEALLTVIAAQWKPADWFICCCL